MFLLSKKRLTTVFSIALILSFSPLLALSEQEAKHLLLRTSLGYDGNDIKRFMAYTKQEAVNMLIQEAQDSTTPPPPQQIKALTKESYHRKNKTPEGKRALTKALRQKNQALVHWWLDLILQGKHPFREKMTLFWHNHFTSSYKKVKKPYYVYLQNQRLRANVLGNFKALVHDMSKDQAMLIYLDGKANKKGAPNENFARELLELFTIGEGQYTQKDIKEAARAFTGYGINNKTLQFQKRRKFQDRGEKLFMGQSGHFDGDDIIDIIFQQEATAVYITQKLYKEFIAFEINEREVRRLAAIFRNSNYNIKVLMQHLLMSKDFWHHRSNLIKSPIEFIYSSLKAMQRPITDIDLLNKFLHRMGQELLNPPNVKGYEGGKAFITSKTLLDRALFIQRITRGEGAFRYLKATHLTKQEFISLYLTLPPLNQSQKAYQVPIQVAIREALKDPIFNLK